MERSELIKHYLIYFKEKRYSDKHFKKNLGWYPIELLYIINKYNLLKNHPIRDLFIFFNCISSYGINDCNNFNLSRNRYNEIFLQVTRSFNGLFKEINNLLFY